MEICRVSLGSSNAAIESSSNVHVRGKASIPRASPRSTLQIADERNTTSSEVEAEEELFQHFTSRIEVEHRGDDEQPPPYHIATGKIPCKHCRFRTQDKNDFVQHFRRKPDHWSCLACKKKFTTFKDFSKHIVRRSCNPFNSRNK